MLVSDSSQSTALGTIGRNFWGSFLAVIIAISPKCPLCWAAYLSFLGLSGATALSIGTWIIPVLAGLFFIHLGAMTKRAIQRKRYLPLALSIAGFAIMLTGYFQNLPVLKYPGVLLILAGSVTSALKAKHVAKTCCSCESKTTTK